MSNRITIEYTKFTNLTTEGEEEFTSFGYRIYDNYANDYNNTFDSFEELTEAVHEGNLLEVLKNHEDFKDVDFEDAMPVASGIEFNGTFYEGEELCS